MADTICERCDRIITPPPVSDINGVFLCAECIRQTHGEFSQPSGGA